MATLYEAIFTAISEDPTLSAMLENNGSFHIYPFVIPEGMLPFPDTYAITFGQITSKKISYLDIEFPLIQFNCIGRTLNDSIELKENLKTLLERFKGNLGNKRIVQYVQSINEFDVQDKATKLYISFIEIRVKLFGNNT